MYVRSIDVYILWSSCENICLEANTLIGPICNTFSISFVEIRRHWTTQRRKLVSSFDNQTFVIFPIELLIAL